MLSIIAEGGSMGTATGGLCNLQATFSGVPPPAPTPLAPYSGSSALARESTRL